MLSFQQYLRELAGERGVANIMFEERRHSILDLTETIAKLLAHEHIPYATIGGMALQIQVEQVDRSAVRNTRDVDILIHRSDLERIKVAAKQLGFEFRHVTKTDMLLPAGETKAGNGIHLIFSGENTKPDQIFPNPPIRPEFLTATGLQSKVAVVTVPDLVFMKLTTFQDKDRVHIRDLDGVGLITPEIEADLPNILHDRLQTIRETE